MLGVASVELLLAGMTRLSPVAELDLTMALAVLSDLTKGLGISGWTLWRDMGLWLDTGRDTGPAPVSSWCSRRASSSSSEILNLGSCSDLVCRCLFLCLPVDSLGELACS